MDQKTIFTEALDTHLENYRLDKTSANFCFEEKEGFDLDFDTTFAEWAKGAGVDYVIIDVGAATQKDIDAIVAHWDRPTAYLFKDFGNEAAGNLREKCRCFIKDRHLGGIWTSADPEPQVIFCAATLTKDQPIRDFYDRISFPFVRHYKF